jgi:hypothetical protein
MIHTLHVVKLALKESVSKPEMKFFSFFLTYCWKSNALQVMICYNGFVVKKNQMNESQSIFWEINIRN